MDAEQARKYADDFNQPRFQDIYASAKGRIADAVNKGEYSVHTTIHLPLYVSRKLEGEGFAVNYELNGSTISW